jgi:hypothetical protein
MSILDDFEDMKIEVTPVLITQAPDENGVWVGTEENGATLRGVVYSRSEASRYYSQTWAVDVSAVLVCDDITNIEKASKLIVNGITYEADIPEDVAFNNLSGFDNVYTVGLKVMK